MGIGTGLSGVMDQALPSAILINGSPQVSDPGDLQETSTSDPVPCPLPEDIPETLPSNVQLHTPTFLSGVSLSPLSSITSLSSSVEPLSQSPKIHFEGSEFSNLVKGEDNVSLLSVSGVSTTSSKELSSLSSSCLLSSPDIAELQNPLQTGATIPSIAGSMSCTPLKTNAETLRKIAPAPPTSTMNLDIAVHRAPAALPVPVSHLQLTQGAKRPQKSSTQKRPVKRRKAGVYDDDEDGIIKTGNSLSDDESDEFTMATTQTKSGRTIHRPTVFVRQQEVTATPVAVKQKSPPRKKKQVRKGKDINITCERCERGHSPMSNAIVFCDECNGAWHQFCHDPPIEMEVISVKELQWFCNECRPVEAAPMSTAGVQADTSNHIPAQTVTTTVYDSNFLESQDLVGGSEFTKTERLAYLSGLSHAALVKLLVRVSDTNPDLKLFPANLRDLRSSIFIAPSSTAEPRNPAIDLSSQEHAPAPGTSVPPASTALQPASEGQTGSILTTINKTPAPALSREEYESEDDYIPEHRLYPKPGNGFRLPPDSVDLDILLEDSGCRTFSHALHGSAKMKVEGVGMEASVGVA